MKESIAKIKSLYELLDLESFRKRPAMYLGTKSITSLRTFSSGYETCALFHGIKEDCKPSLWLFYIWVSKKFNCLLSLNWDGIILKECNGNEAAALDMFFELFDEFRKIKPVKIVTAEVSNKALSFFQDEGSKVFTSYNLQGNPIEKKPMKNIAIVEYSNEFGSTIGTNDYYKTFDAAMQKVSVEYGDSLIWKEIDTKELGEAYLNLE